MWEWPGMLRARNPHSASRLMTSVPVAVGAIVAAALTDADKDVLGDLFSGSISAN